MIPVCHNLRGYGNRAFACLATDGKGTMGVVSRIYQKTNKAKKRNRLIDICTKKNLKSLFM